MKRLSYLLVVCVWLLSTGLPLATPVAAAATRQGSIDPTPDDPAQRIQSIMEKMTVADKVGQLFLVTFEGTDASPSSDIATLVRDYKIGGIVLLPVNDNFRETPVEPPPTAAGKPDNITEPLLLSTPQQITRLTNGLQALALRSPLPITITQPITVGTAVTVPSTAVSVESPPTALPMATASPGSAAEAITPTASVPPDSDLGIPLLIGLDWTGDDTSFFSGQGGYTPLPSAMAIGATWSPELAGKVGEVVGQELHTTGVNLLLGPTLDVLDVPRPDSKGDLGTRTFGGDPFWVGQIGRAFISGVQIGSEGGVLTAAKHFPGQGASDRRPDDEVATVQKPVEQLRQIELAPFAAVTTGGDPWARGNAAALLTSHIRYRGFQGNIRQLTPPIGLAPELKGLMELEEFAGWRSAGGVLISDALGVPAVRRYYDPQLQNFPHRQVAQDAFLAGNDLLYLSRFALTDEWADQFEAIKETIEFFRVKYQSDNEFQARVDESVRRILGLKLAIYDGNWTRENIWRNQIGINEVVGQQASVTYTVARSSLTLIYPGRDELTDRMPSGPLADESIVIFTDARPVQACPECVPAPLIPANALEEIMLRLYGPSSTRQISPESIHSLTFRDLNRMLSAPADQYAEVEAAINDADWLIFAQLDYNPDLYPESAALRNFLAKRSDSLRDKRLVVMAFSAPYYLDTTEISKLTAYFGVYGRTTPFLETAVRALFREFSPVGAPPVTVTGINYELIRQLEPNPAQIIPLGVVRTDKEASGSIQVGSVVSLETGIILDQRGHPVPDGTPVEFRLGYPAEALELAPKVVTTIGGRARTAVELDRPGELWITVKAGDAKDSTRIQLRVGGDAPGSIETVVPTPAPPTSTPTEVPPPTSAPTLTPQPRPNPTPVPSAGPAKDARRVALPAFLYALLGTLLSGWLAFVIRRDQPSTTDGLSQAWASALSAGAVAWIAYLLYVTGWLPGATILQSSGFSWAAGVITLIGGLLSLIWKPGRAGMEEH